MGGVDADVRVRPVALALGLIVAFLVTETVVSIVSGSLALLADAGHQLADAGALAGTLVALRLSRRPATEGWSWGFHRAEVLSAALNGVTLAVVAVLVLAESVRRLLHPLAVRPVAVLVVGACALVVNLAATSILGRAGHARMDLRAALAHLVTDVWGALAALASGVVILATGYARADALASLVVVAIMARTSFALVAESGRVLFEAAPAELEVERVRDHLLGTDRVLDVHDLHVWLVASGLPALSAHVVVAASCFEDGQAPALLDRLQDCLAGHFDLEHSTFQLEPPGHETHELAVHPRPGSR